MSEPSTKTLDHIIHLTPPGTVDEVSNQFRELGFNVLPGGTHTGGLTANALVVLQDGVYLELIAFTHPASYYPPTSPSRQKRESHRWAHKAPGWIDYAFLGSPSVSISQKINDRAKADGSGVVYLPEMKGGRVRPDGKVLEWVISVPGEEHERGILPFFCGDITPREWRVPLEPPANAQHPSSASGIAHIRVLVDEKEFPAAVKQLTSVIGCSPVTQTATDTIWALKNQSQGGRSDPRLILSLPRDAEEERLSTDGLGIYEVAFWIDRDHEEGCVRTPYGRISWRHQSD